MNTALLLLDWDGVVMDREKVRDLQQKKSIELLGDATKSKDFWNLYDEVREARKGKIEVDEFIDGFDEKHREIARSIFYDIPFDQCVDAAGWKHLVGVAEKGALDIKLFSQGSKNYQKLKTKSSGLDITDEMLNLGEKEFYVDKLQAFSSELWSEIHDLGYTACWYVDDTGAYLDTVYRISGEKVKPIWMDTGREPENRPKGDFEKVRSLDELGDLLQLRRSTVEGGTVVGMDHARNSVEY